jgi:hypothetical protein
MDKAPTVLSTDSAQIAALMKKTGFIGLHGWTFSQMTYARSEEPSALNKKVLIPTATVSLTGTDPNTGAPRKFDFQLTQRPAFSYEGFNYNSTRLSTQQEPAKADYKVKLQLGNRPNINGDIHVYGGFAFDKGRMKSQDGVVLGMGEDRVLGTLFSQAPAAHLREAYAADVLKKKSGDELQESLLKGVKEVVSGAEALLPQPAQNIKPAAQQKSQPPARGFKPF